MQSVLTNRPLGREKIEKGDYEAEFPLRWMQKDMHLATVSGYESGVALPQTNVTKEIYRLAMREGHGTNDFSIVYEYLTHPSDFRQPEKQRPLGNTTTSTTQSRNSKVPKSQNHELLTQHDP